MVSTPDSTAPGASRTRLAVAGVVALSFVLRALLVAKGGQYFWPDEGRFETARTAARALLRGNIGEAASAVFSGADHLLFKLLAVGPALLQVQFDTGLWLPALFFAAVSAWTIWLVGRVAMASGACEREQLVAVVLAACTSSLFYFSRHLFPYDLSLAFSLLGVIASLTPTGAPMRRDVLVGVWASLAFLTYNGYWMVGAVLLSVHTLLPWQGFLANTRRGALAFAGLIAPIALVLLWGRLMGHDLIQSYLKFAGTVNQGDFGIAWRFIPEYFWQADGPVVLIWFASVLAASAAVLRSSATPSTRRWLLITVLLYLALVVPSDVVPKFTVAARHVRILAPFLCLLAASVLWNRIWPERVARRMRRGAVGLACVSACFSFAMPLRQMFPVEFSRRSYLELPRLVREDLGPYRVENDYFLHNPDWVPAKPAKGRMVMRREHPFQFLPYLYEGYSELARTRYLQRDMSMRIVRLDCGGPPRTGHPGAFRMTVKWDLLPRGYQPEPILTTGKSGAGDMLYMFYDENQRLRFALDHWGTKHVISEAVELDRTARHELIVSIGSLYPPADTWLFKRHPELLPLKGHCYVSFDGRVVLNTPVEPYPNEAHEVYLGLNQIYASTAVARMDAMIERIDYLSTEEEKALVRTFSE